MNKIAEILEQELTYVPQSREILRHRVSRVMDESISDRQIRAAKQELIKAGVCVCSNSKTKGYWLGDEDERRHTANEMRKRARELWEEADKIDKVPMDGQMVMEVF